MASRPQDRSFRHAEADPAELAWDEYLRKLAEPSGPLSLKRLREIERLWRALRGQVTVHLPPPYATATEDGEFVMTWDRDSHHFEIEILPDGKYEWFYLDRSSGESCGEEDHPLGTYSPEMISRLCLTIV